MSGHKWAIPWWIIGIGALLLGIGLWLGGNAEAGEHYVSVGIVWVSAAVGVHIGAAGGRFDAERED